MSVWHEKIQCQVDNLSYDFDKHEGHLNLPPLNKPDMRGTIEVFKTIDPDVETIVVRGEHHASTLYRRDAYKKWQASRL